MVLVNKATDAELVVPHGSPQHRSAVCLKNEAWVAEVQQSMWRKHLYNICQVLSCIVSSKWAPALCRMLVLSRPPSFSFHESFFKGLARALWGFSAILISALQPPISPFMLPLSFSLTHSLTLYHRSSPHKSHLWHILVNWNFILYKTQQCSTQMLLSERSFQCVNYTMLCRIVGGFLFWPWHCWITFNGSECQCNPEQTDQISPRI